MTFGIWPKMVLAMIDCWQLKKDRMVQVISDPWVRSLSSTIEFSPFLSKFNIVHVPMEK